VVKDGVWLEGYYLVQEEGKTYVWAESSLKLLEKREVTLGTFNEELGQYEILSGLDREDYIAFPTEELHAFARTTKEAESQSGQSDTEGNHENELQLDDDIFQEFDNEGTQGDDREEQGPVGSIPMPMEVLL